MTNIVDKAPLNESLSGHLILYSFIFDLMKNPQLNDT
jgi:hypothetical protein